MSFYMYSKFISSGENLYVIDRMSKHLYEINKLDFDEMKLVRHDKSVEEYMFFFSDLSNCIDTTAVVMPHPQSL